MNQRKKKEKRRKKIKHKTKYDEINNRKSCMLCILDIYTKSIAQLDTRTHTDTHNVIIIWQRMSFEIFYDFAIILINIQNSFENH